MLTKFMCQDDYLQKLEILDFDPPEAGDDGRYPAMINNSQLVLIRMTDVGSNVQCDDLSLLSICQGLLETEVLPSLSTLQIKTEEINALVFIEKLNQNVIYRYR